MADLKLHTVIEAVGGKQVNIDTTLLDTVQRISTDTRTLAPGELYIAFRGQQYDGHEFISQAIEKGAAAAIVDEKWYIENAAQYETFPFLVAEDTVKAYGRIAHAYRAFFNVKIIAVTGTNGKTTAKELIAAALGTKYSVLQSEGNNNNQIGLPKTLLRLERSHEFAVVEMGTNQPGDIQDLCEIVAPDMGIITNIGDGHLEKLSSREEIAREKKTLYASLAEGGIAMVNSDDEWLNTYVNPSGKTIRFGYDPGADIRITTATPDGAGHLLVEIQSAGDVEFRGTVRMHAVSPHIAYAVAIAMGTGFAYGCDAVLMQEAFEAYRLPKRRMTVISIEGIIIIDDSYNSNPSSLRAAIEALEALPCAGKKRLVLGDMLELGEASSEMHKEIGLFLHEKHIDTIYTIGIMSQYISDAPGLQGKGRHYDSEEQLIQDVLAQIGQGDCILFKGSNATRVWNIADTVCHNLETQKVQ